MQLDNITLYIVVVPAALIIFGIWQLLQRRKEANVRDSKGVENVVAPIDSQDDLPLPDAIECRLYDSTIRSIYNTELSGEIVRQIQTNDGNLGRKWSYYGKWVYAINKYFGEAGAICYRPVFVPQTMDNPPSKLHRALKQEAVEIAYSVREKKGFFEQHGKFLLFAGVIAFLMFVMVMGK